MLENRTQSREASEGLSRLVWNVWPEEERKKTIADIAPELLKIEDNLTKKGLYFILYTHSWNESDKSRDILALPKDQRLGKSEFINLVIELVFEYFALKGYEIEGDEDVARLTQILSRVGKVNEP